VAETEAAPHRYLTRRRLWIAAALLLGVVLVAGLYYRDYRVFLYQPLPATATGVEFEVGRGDSLAKIAGVLYERQVIQRPFYWQIHARLRGLASRIQAGEYRIAAGTTPHGLLEQLASGRVIQYSLTIAEGWTFRQLRETLARHPKLRQTLTGLSDAELMARLDRPGRHPEGRFFPDTYFFPAGFSDLEFLKRAQVNLERRLQEIWSKRASDLPLTNPEQALILASLIEKETAVPAERREIAGVFIRRLQKGMRLQADPTVIYGLGDAFDGNLRKEHLLRDTPYNSYTRSGLPPTPIALPGVGSLAAAVDPAPGDALYFVATGDGKHVFSRTLAEHQRMVQRYQLRR
jgi:UPF0755 protein